MIDFPSVMQARHHFGKALPRIWVSSLLPFSFRYAGEVILSERSNNSDFPGIRDCLQGVTLWAHASSCITCSFIVYCSFRYLCFLFLQLQDVLVPDVAGCCR